jgi:hypothetical protein
MDDERKMELLFDLMKRPIPWDPIPPWLKLDEKMQRQFAQMEIKFQIKEFELQQQKLQEFTKIVGIG